MSIVDHFLFPRHHHFQFLKFQRCRIFAVAYNFIWVIMSLNTEKGEPEVIVDHIERTEPGTKTYFRFRQAKKNSAVPARPPLTIPKHRNDFYSLQKEVQSRVQTKQKKFISTTADFYSTARSKFPSAIDAKKPNSLRKTFYLPKGSEEGLGRPPSSSLLYPCSPNNSFRRRDIYQDDHNSNYLSKYHIIKQLGKGSFSTVFLARKKRPSNNSDSLSQKEDIISQDEQLVAIKVYQKFKMNKDPHKFKNIRKEINIMQHLQNDGILKLYESVQTLTKISLVVEYGGDQSLLEYVKQQYPLSLENLRDISLQILQGLHYIHQRNIVHRDIKLQNILIHKGQVKLIDFGFSCLTHRNQKLNTICGTPNYMAPQVISRKEYIGQEVDIWSYGVVVYALAEGRHPFKADSYNELERLVNRGRYEFKRSTYQPFLQFIRKILRVKGSERPRTRDLLEARWFRQLPQSQ